MRRRLFTILAAVSMLIFVAVALLWARSFSGGDFLGRTSRHIDGPHVVEEGWGLHSDRGHLGFAIGTYFESVSYRASYDPTPPRAVNRLGLMPIDEVVHARGPVRDGDGLFDGAFSWGDARYHWGGRWDGMDHRRFLVVPHWFLLLLTAVLPALAGYRYLRRRVRLVGEEIHELGEASGKRGCATGHATSGHLRAM